MEKNNVIYVEPRCNGKPYAMRVLDLRVALDANDTDKIDVALLRLGIVDDKVRKTFAAVLLELARKGKIPPAPQEDIWPPLCESDAELIGNMSDGLTVQEVGLLSAMVRCARARPHPTNRIRYEDDRLMRESRLKDMKTYRATFASLGKKELVKVAVVGSKNPVTTFELPWLPKEDI